MHHFDLNAAAATHNGGGGNQSAALAAAAAAFAAAAEQQQQQSTVAAGEHPNGASQPGLTWPHNTLLGMPSPIQSATVSSWRLPTSYDYRTSTVSPTVTVSASQPNDLSNFAGISGADWRGNSWSPRPPTSSTPQQQFQSLLGSPSWTSPGGIATPTPIHPSQNAAANLFGLNMEQLMNAALSGAGGGGGVVAEMSSPVFRTPGHLNGGIKQELVANGAHINGNNGLSTNGTNGISELGVSNSKPTVAFNNGEEMKPRIDHERVNQNKLAAMRLDEKIKAETEARKILQQAHAASKIIFPTVPLLPTVSVSPAPPLVPELQLKEEPTSEESTVDQELPPVCQKPQQQATGSATFLRAPGLGPIDPAEAGNGGGDESKKLYDCEYCGFSTGSKFHYNSHMNTHGDHKCKMCDYTSRTEGRLKKHMGTQHTQAQREAVGYVEAPATNGHQQRASESPEEGAEGTLALEHMRALAERPTSADRFDLGSDRPGPSNINNDDAGPATSGSPSKGKPIRKQRTKRLVCKQCEHVSSTREEAWAHKQTHIPKSRQMACPRPNCEFMTGYKHHLDYHVKNHDGVKPFFCKKCAYRCVNKSMLNSHMKSHSDSYMFKCLDCTYAAKHSHSLHTHLQKYGHRRMPREMVERENGIQNGGGQDDSGSERNGADGGHEADQASAMSALLPTTSSIDLSVLFSRHNEASINADLPSPAEPSSLPNLSTLPSGLQCNFCDHKSASNDEQMRHTIQHLIQHSASNSALNFSGFNLDRPLPASSFLAPSDILGPPPVLQPQLAIEESSAQDPTETMDVDEEHPMGRERSQSEDSTRTFTSSEADSLSAPSGSKKRKPNKTVKLDMITQRLRERGPQSHSNSDEHSDELRQPPSNCSSLGSNNSSTSTGHSSEPRREEKVGQLQETHHSKPDEWRFVCNFCEMAFQDHAIYVIHRDYHSLHSPFKCNRCAHQCSDKLSFNVHLMEAKHD